ncbi:MAG: FprA family A-type flavoprotein [Lachnospiraceae bacterium]|jgi:flavorubredoxin|nr:FprA family A-type flavoprotein [Lachnospiraceae bacterium]MCI2196171.1 FprA family A-type flavoprotein [Lachnospiraceae bacterium]
MYNVRKITDDIYWCGANDHRLHLFENIHPIPQGVSYNCYLLLDEHPTLFDTVDWSACRQMIENLQYLLGDRPLEYLVINHLEPDHAACIEEILLIWPDVQLISTEKGFMLARQFGFSVDRQTCHTVKEGDTFSFGKHTVTFVEAPMVHWPEPMVTLDLTDGVLFSADAFGSFIANDGKMFADEVNYDRDYIDEARRYLVNIVGKYGPHVQLLLGKAAAVLDKIKIIAPLHGLCWRKDLMYFISKYDLWSRYEPEEKGVLIVYASMYGNTESAAQALASRLCEKGVTNVKVCDVSNTHVSYLISDAFKYSHLVLASVTYNLNIYPVMFDFLDEMRMLNLQNRTVAIVENGSWACKSGDLMQKYIDENMKNMTILNERLSLASTLSADKSTELEQLADAIVESVQAE